jgi:RNA polymerase sigma-70 factor (ECF subfamily)
MADPDEIALIRRCKSNDNSAFNELLLAHQDKVFNTIHRMVNDRDEACDICQETFLRAFKSISDFQGDASFSTWVHRIAINLCLSYRRDRKRNPAITMPLGHQSDSTKIVLTADPPDTRNEPSARAADRDRIQIIQQAIGSLDEEFRSVIVLRDIDGYSYGEIAGMVGCPAGTVRSRIFRARELLKEKLKGIL